MRIISDTHRQNNDLKPTSHDTEDAVADVDVFGDNNVDVLGDNLLDDSIKTHLENDRRPHDLKIPSFYKSYIDILNINQPQTNVVRETENIGQLNKTGPNKQEAKTIDFLDTRYERYGYSRETDAYARDVDKTENICYSEYSSKTDQEQPDIQPYCPRDVSPIQVPSSNW